MYKLLCEKSFDGVSNLSVDIVVVGGGLCGTLTSILLSRTGCRVALIDFYDVYPSDFRSEQLVGEQIEKLKKLDLLDIITHNIKPLGRAIASRAGQTINVVNSPHYGIRYDGMVNNARGHIPSSVHFIKAQVLSVDLSATYQRIKLSNGKSVEARLVVMATGLGQRLLSQLGITKKVIHSAQSLAFGFDVKVESTGLANRSLLVAYGEKTTGAIDYITFFPVGNILRSNLFTYTDPKDVWVKNFLQKPIETLQHSLPHLEQMTGKILETSVVDFRINDITVASDFIRDGIVLVGDAFQTSSPASGTGVTRLLNDIDRLCNVYIPLWLKTDIINSAKINQFYNDPIKRKYDAKCLRITKYRRSYVVAKSLRWKIHRQRVTFQSRLRLWINKKVNLPL